MLARFYGVESKRTAHLSLEKEKEKETFLLWSPTP